MPFLVGVVAYRGSHLAMLYGLVLATAEARLWCVVVGELNGGYCLVNTGWKLRYTGAWKMRA